MKRKVEILFSAVLVFVFAVAVLEARHLQVYARLLPWIIGFPMVLLAMLQLGLAIRDRKGRTVESGGGQMSFDLPGALVRRRTLNSVAWLLSLFLAIWLLGFSISVPLFLFLYLKLNSRERWWFAVLLSVVGWGFFYLFTWGVELSLPEALLFRWWGG